MVQAVLILGAFLSGYWLATQQSLPIVVREKKVCPKSIKLKDCKIVLGKFQADAFHCLVDLDTHKRKLKNCEELNQAIIEDSAPCSYH